MTADNAARADAAIERPFSIARLFDAPRQRVWRAWTEADRLAQWWGPKDFANTVARLDLRPGGHFHYGMRTPDGQQMWGRFVYREIVPPERLAFVVSFADENGEAVRAPWDANWPLRVLNTLTLSDQADKTALLLEGLPIEASEAEHRLFAEMHASMQQGFTGTLDQLAAYLAAG